jgi:NAD(P)H-dependent flavin oxidoreductase YrpB (nitropropane dioxygenase family)
MLQTQIPDMFGIKYPIICGAMMWICKPRLCAAISNAGGMEYIDMLKKAGIKLFHKVG